MYHIIMDRYTQQDQDKKTMPIGKQGFPKLITVIVVGATLVIAGGVFFITGTRLKNRRRLKKQPPLRPMSHLYQTLSAQIHPLVRHRWIFLIPIPI